MIRVGTRKSRLAQAQTEKVVEILERETGRSYSIQTLETLGDKENWKSIEDIEGEGVFTRELDEALINDAIDLAVHSCKDVPTRMRSEIKISGYIERGAANDVLVGGALDELPEGGVIGTGSPRRQAIIKKLRPDLKLKSIRGNIDTRIRKARDGDVDAVMLAEAGLHRLELEDKIDYRFKVPETLPAPAQGALCITCRANDREMEEICSAVDHKPTRYSVVAERAAMNEFGYGCTTPVGAYGQVDEKLVFTLEHIEIGERVKVVGEPTNAEKIGRKAARMIMDKNDVFENDR
ncbi:Porphobilinogen deaminase HemC [Methanonatronarchaeum thermophilum]|uniref:Hydroxymethylbilane synthase n=1 Tax=Methanonatronarchaeum thermophilum TaxID=1927129 RepID=A0A1Y3GCV3_9EURY|nr:hydroxymethylbilane synthase [Methanonatronarchaeum thermophilum]OUJ19292.1 Porphobilinogen deaminase HemC [Methanonatronarchaeum thermophilum]